MTSGTFPFETGIVVAQEGALGSFPFETGIVLEQEGALGSNTTEMYGDGPTTELRQLRDEAGLPPVVYMVRPTSGKV